MVARLADDGLSVVVPVLNEGAGLADQLTLLTRHLESLPHVEIIVSDGGSHDDTLAIARGFDCRVVTGPAGRARQLNHGASIAVYPWLLFLHADTRLPSDFHSQITTSGDWGFFKLRLTGSAQAFRVIEFMINWRSSLSGIGTGDQGQFFRREFFHSIGGYPDIPLMEDVAICKRAKQQIDPAVIESPVTTSSRRWEQHGVIKTVLLMWWLRFAFWVGISADKLHRMYYRQT